MADGIPYPANANFRGNESQSGHPAPARGAVSLAALWFGLLGGPLGWSIQTLVNLPVASHGCFPRLEPLDHPGNGNVSGIAFVVSIFAALICLAALGVAVRTWARTRGEQQPASGSGQRHEPGTALTETGEGRTRFMALCGVLTSLTFLVLIAVHMASIFIVSPCAS
jgi:hypothetical protein